MRVAVEQACNNDRDSGSKRTHGGNKFQCSRDASQKNDVRCARERKKRGINGKCDEGKNEKSAQVLGENQPQVRGDILNQAPVVTRNGSQNRVTNSSAVL